MKFFALSALVASAQAGFPSFDSFHAHCQIDYTVDASCADTYALFDSSLNGFQDPASPQGTYSLKSKSPSSEIWNTRVTANGKYTDDVRFNFNGSGDSCAIKAQSQSKSLSYYDYSVNFCNMFNVMRSTYPDLQISQVSSSKCGYPASDIATCDRY